MKRVIKDFWSKIVDSYFESNPSSKKKTFEKRPECDFCFVQKAVWENYVMNTYCCDECVPRGCSCRLVQRNKQNKFSIDSYTYMIGEDGLELPCEDWHKF